MSLFAVDQETRGDVIRKYVLRSAVAVVFISIGWSKFEANSEWIRIFQSIGLGQWFRYFTGTVQLLGGLLVLFRRAFIVGILLLSSTMIGAMLTWLFILRLPYIAIMPGAILLGLFFIGGEELISVFERMRARRPQSSNSRYPI